MLMSVSGIKWSQDVPSHVISVSNLKISVSNSNCSSKQDLVTGFHSDDRLAGSVFATRAVLTVNGSVIISVDWM